MAQRASSCVLRVRFKLWNTGQEKFKMDLLLKLGNRFWSSPKYVTIKVCIVCRFFLRETWIHKVKSKVTVLSPHPGSELCSADFDKYLPWSLGLLLSISVWITIITLQCCILAHTSLFSPAYVTFQPSVRHFSAHCTSLFSPVAVPILGTPPPSGKNNKFNINRAKNF